MACGKGEGQRKKRQWRARKGTHARTMPNGRGTRIKDKGRRNMKGQKVVQTESDAGTRWLGVTKCAVRLQQGDRSETPQEAESPREVRIELNSGNSPATERHCASQTDGNFTSTLCTRYT